MSQPIWKCVGNLGDANPIEHGGLLVFVDKTGVYPPEMERIQPNDDGETWERRRVVLDPCTHVNGILSDNKFHPDHSAWFATPESRRAERPQDTTYLSNVCDTMDVEMDEIIRLFCSDEPMERAHAWRMVGDYHGWDNLDECPDTDNRLQITARIRRKDIQAIL